VNRYVSLQIRFASDTLRFRYASLQIDLADGVTCLGGGL